ncbi:hypothetical protein PAERUG_P18_London_17_VIM_2_04_10_02600 [Pseudomonas aeruginosa]|nr:hypothetical protein PAERUG_P18_London_17_VIM_2_04_10_02600 [Pseudomonas aeruginosa]
MQRQASAQRHGLPPVDLHDVGETCLADQPGVAQAADHLGRRPAPVELAQGFQVEVVVVVVAHQHQVDRWQLVERQPGRMVALRADEGERADPLRPDRVGEDVQAAVLDQQGGVVDVGDPQFFAAGALVHPWRRCRRRQGEPRALRRAVPLPLEQVAQALVRGRLDIAETFAVEMVRRRTLIGAASAAGQGQQADQPGGTQGGHEGMLLRSGSRTT